MKKLSLLLGTLGGGLAGYLFSNTTLRDQLAKAKDAEHAAKILGAHLQKDGKKLAKQVQVFMESDEVQNNIKKAKQFAQKKVEEASKELNAALSSGTKKAEKAAKREMKRVGAKAKKAVRRMETKVRKLA